ncbi:MAG: AmmeMemoRadiSam system protein B [Planctomycetota bacterium]
MDKPRLRPIEAFPTESERGPMVVIRDPTGLASEMLVMSPEAFLILSLLDGTRTLPEIRVEAARRAGCLVPPGAIEEMLSTLDERRFLQSESFAGWRHQLLAEYLARVVRAMALAGEAYPADRAACAPFLDEILGCAPAVDLDGTLRGLIAPHIDLRRGARGFAAAYRAFGESAHVEGGAWDVVIVLGTAHFAEKGRFILGRHSFETPLAPINCDRPLVEAIERRYPGDLHGDPLAHRREHSIEFQALFLAHTAGPRVPSIVPILATSFDDLMERGEVPWQVPEIEDLVETLREVVHRDGRRVLFLAGADLSHVGLRFGDATPAEGALADAAERVDRAALEAIERVDPAAFYTAVAEARNATRICSVASLYVVLAACGGRRARTLHYEQALEDDGSSMVSFASAALLGDGSDGQR